MKRTENEGLVKFVAKKRKKWHIQNNQVYWSNKTTSIIGGFEGKIFMAHWKHLDCQSFLFSPFCSNSSFWPQNFFQIHAFCPCWWCWLAEMYPCIFLRPAGRCQRWAQMMLTTAWMCPWRWGDLILGHAGQENMFWNGQLLPWQYSIPLSSVQGRALGV